MHDARQASAANDALAQFKTFQQTSSNPYTAMLRNHDKVDRAATATQEQLARQSATTFAKRVPDETWATIRDELRAQQAAREEINNDLTKEVKKLIEEKKGTAVAVQDFADGLKRAQQLLVDAVKEQQQWEARQALFKRAITFIADTSAAPNGSPSPETLKAAKNNILDQTITVETLKVSDGSDTELMTTSTTIGTALQDDLATLKEMDFSTLVTRYTVGTFASAPGINVVILSLGVDLASARLQRAKLETNYIKARIDALTALQQGTDNIRAALRILTDSLRDGTVRLPETPLDTLNRLRPNAANSAAEILDIGRILGYWAIANTVDASSREQLKTRPAVLRHEYEIRLAKIQAEEREAVISRGLQGLAVYHSGGITQEMIANLLRAAQAAALAVIAIGVL